MPPTTPIEKTIQASFKGVPFLVRTEEQDGGRKVAVHEYPGSDVRFVQDLGKRPGIFRIDAYVGGDDWIQQSKRLTTVLESETEGILDLSTFGRFKVKAQTFNKVLRQTTLGIIDFKITFLVSKPTPSPTRASSSTQTVAGATVRTMEAVEEIVAEKLTAPDLAATALVSTYDGTQITTTIADSIKALGQNIDNITGFADNIRDNITDLVRDPIAYADAMFNDGLLGAIFDTVAVSKDTLNALSKLARVGYNLAQDFESIEDDLLSNLSQSFNIPEFADNTGYRRISNRNRTIIVNGVRASIFGIYLNIAARNEYTTDSEIEDVISDIEDIYENVILIGDTSPEVATALDNCRIEALSVLDTKIQITPKIIEIKLKAPTVDVELAYSLYAEEFTSTEELTTKAEVLTDLNGILPNRYKAETNIKVLKV